MKYGLVGLVAVTIVFGIGMLSPNLASAVNSQSKSILPDKSDSIVLDMVGERASKAWQAWRVRAENTDGLKVMWWNIADGELAENQNVNVLAGNLELISSSRIAPDVLMFGEFSPRAIPKSTLDFLHSHYSFTAFTAYGPRSGGHGLQVFSKFPLKSLRKKILAWTPNGLSKTQTDEFHARWSDPLKDSANAFYERTANELQIQWRGEVISIIPLHLAEPWAVIHQTVKSGIESKAETVFELFAGEQNPLITQIKDLVSWLEDGSGRKRIIMGDFNLPTGVGPVPTAGYSLLSSHFQSALKTTANSFPTPSSPLARTYPGVQIDHAFTQGAVHSALSGVLPLRGSDHFPIYVIYK